MNIKSSLQSFQHKLSKRSIEKIQTIFYYIQIHQIPIWKSVFSAEQSLIRDVIIIIVFLETSRQINPAFTTQF